MEHWRIKKLVGDVPIEILTEVVHLQKELLLPKDYISYDTSKGFLVSQQSISELSELLSTTHEMIIAEDPNTSMMVGYMIITKGKELTDLGSISNCIAPEWIQLEEIEYISQIAVRREMMNKKVGSAMMQHLLRERKEPLLLDIVIFPVENRASLAFFKSIGCKSIGILKLDHYKELDELHAEVLLWLPQDHMY